MLKEKRKRKKTKKKKTDGTFLVLHCTNGFNHYRSRQVSVKKKLGLDVFYSKIKSAELTIKAAC